MKCFVLCSALLVGLLPSAVAQTSPLELNSPDHQLLIRFAIKPSASGPGGQLIYSASFRGKPILDDSALGLELNQQPALGSDMRIVESKAGSGVDDYTLSNQKVSKVHDAYNSLVIRTEESAAPHRA